MWKRSFLAAMIAICCICFGLQFAYAQSYEDYLEESVQNHLEQIGGQSLLEDLPNETGALLEELGLEELSFSALLSLTPAQFGEVLLRWSMDALKKPLLLFSVVLAVVLLCAMLGGMQQLNTDPSINTVFGVVAVLCMSAVLSGPVVACIQQTAAAIQGCASFLLGLIPMLAGAMIAAGQPLSGSTFQIFLFTACQIASQVTANILIPCLGIYLALGLVSCTMPDIHLEEASALLKKGIVWALGLMLSLFIGLMSVQSLVAGAADGATAKATRFVISNLVPVVGGAVSDAFMATQGCLRLLKTTLGGFGIVVAGAFFLPVLLRTVLWYSVVNLSAAIGSLLGAEQVSRLMKTFLAALGMLISLLLSFAIMVITSITIILLLGIGA